MKDSRIGAIGAVSVVCLILAKFVLLREIIESRQVGIGRPFTEGTGTKIVCIASIVPIAGSIISFELWGFFLICITLFITLITLWLAKRKIGGVTGDILGAINEITVVILLLSIAMVGSLWV